MTRKKATRKTVQIHFMVTERFRDRMDAALLETDDDGEPIYRSKTDLFVRAINRELRVPERKST